MYQQLNYTGPEALEIRLKAYLRNGAEKSGMKKMAFAAKMLEKAMDMDLMDVYRPAKEKKNE